MAKKVENKFCPNCGNALNEQGVCTNCNPVKEEAKTVEVITTTAAPKKSNGMALAGFIISLVSVLLCCGGFSWLGLIFSIIGVVKAKQLDGNGKGLGIAGIIISSIGMILVIVGVCLIPVFGQFVSDQVENEWDSYSDNYDYDYDDYDYSDYWDY